MIGSPFDRVPEKASIWDRGRTEGCGGEKSVSGGSLGFSHSLKIYRSGIRSDGATWGPQGNKARLPPRACPVAFSSPHFVSGLIPKLLGSLMSGKKTSKTFVAFGLHLVLIFSKNKNKQKTTTGTRHWINRLVPKNGIK